MAILKVEKLCKSFGGLRAVHNLDLEVDEGETIGIIGPNGSGKTTALNLLTGTLKPDSGKITFYGKDITGFPRYKACQTGIARTFQLVKPFLEFTALENVLVGRVYGQEPTMHIKLATEESMELLTLVGLAEKANVVVKDLTLMQRKRLELARALAAKPQLLLLDELMAGLNPREADEACCLIKEIREIKKSKITVLMVEHIVKAICDLSDRIIVLNMGEKIAEGLPQEIVHNPKVIEVYLGTNPC